jgi:hypothetical protein
MGFAVAAATLGMVGCTQQLPPPEAPSHELAAEVRREAARTEAPEGQGVVVLDVTEGTASVREIGQEGDGAGGSVLCETPCVTTLSLGEHRLQFRSGDRVDEVDLLVEETPRAHRRTMSYDTGAHEEWLSLGVTGVLFGGASLLLIDPLTSMDDNFGPADAALVTAAALGGAALVAGITGVVLAIVDPRKLREGVSSEWRLEL